MNNWIRRQQRRMRGFGISNLMLYISATMLAVYVLNIAMQGRVYNAIYFSRALFFSGEIWRVVTFLFMPPLVRSPLLIFFALYFYYFVGSSLENQWGSSSFTFYYMLGVVGAVVAGFISGMATNTYLNLSLFLAFAQLYPEYEILLFFFIPVKVKYIGYANWILYLFTIAIALFRLDWATIAAVLASLINFFVFFGGDFWNRLRTDIKYYKRRREFRRNRNMY